MNETGFGFVLEHSYMPIIYMKDGLKGSKRVAIQGV
jgi:hypothetical protein